MWLKMWLVLKFFKKPSNYLIFKLLDIGVYSWTYKENINNILTNMWPNIKRYFKAYRYI